MSNISSWSSTAASNNSASPNGFPEGMLPSGVNDSCREIMAGVRSWYENAEWINRGHTPTFVSTVSFTIPTDVTAIYHSGRRLCFTDASTLYGTISTSVYSAPNTTITVSLDSGDLSASLSAVAVGLLSNTNRSSPEIGSPPAGVIIPWSPGYFTDGANGGYTYKLGTANTVAAGNVWLAANYPKYRICNGANVGVIAGSPIFTAAGAYLPNLTDSRFLMGNTTAGGIGGATSSAHTHTHTHTAPAHYHGLGTAAAATNSTGSHTHNLPGTDGSAGSYARQYGNTGFAFGTAWPTEAAGAHSHTVSLSGSIGATGSGISGDSAMTTGGDSSAASATENRPLFLSCFYIMKVV